MASTSSRRRSKGKQVTYVDVDSDVDMTEDDKQIAVAKAEEKKRMSTLKVTRTDYDNRQQYSKIADWESGSARIVKRARKGTEAQVANESKSDAQIEKPGALARLLEMPHDVIFECCSRMDPETLLQLTRSTRVFYDLLVSPAGRSIWFSSRQRYGIPNLSYHDLDEFGYASLLFGKPKCEICSEKGKRRLDWFMRVCDACLQDITLPPSAAASKIYHKNAKACTLAIGRRDLELGMRVRTEYSPRYLLPDIEAVSAQLDSLETADLEESEKLAMLRLKQGSRSRRQVIGDARDLDASIPAPDRVNRYVKECEENAVKRWLERQSVFQALQAYRNEEREAIEDANRRMKKREEQARAARADILRTFGWTESTLAVLRSDWGWRACADRLAAPHDDPHAWASLRERIDEAIKKRELAMQSEKARQQSEHRRTMLKMILLDKYDELQGEGWTTSLGIMPQDHDFLEIQSVKACWSTEAPGVDVAPEISIAQADSNVGAAGSGSSSAGTSFGSSSAASSPLPSSAVETFCDRQWTDQLDAVKRDLESWVQEQRVHAIVQILSATEDRPVKHYSTNPADYPTNVYDEAFFCRITSLFHVKYPLRFFYQPSEELQAVAFPHTLALSRTPLRVQISTQIVNAVRELLRVAKLDEATATRVDLDKYQWKWSWLNNPGSMGGSQRFDWLSLVERVAKISKRKSLGIRFALRGDRGVGQGSAVASTSRADTTTVEPNVSTSTSTSTTSPSERAFDDQASADQISDDAHDENY